MDWSHGYVTETNYTHGYYQELNPQFSEILFLLKGIRPPKIKYACELGFGQGVNLCFNACTENVTWYGTDFNPSHVASARDLNVSDRLNLYDDDFESFSIRDIPNFDFICLHGVWSWISDANRKTIVSFIKNKLNPGGIVYMSYNTVPGWSPIVPMRELMLRYFTNSTNKNISISDRIGDTIDFIEKLRSSDALFFKNNPSAITMFEKIKTQDKNYLAHEYFNSDWHPMSIGKIDNWLKQAKLTFLCSADYLSNVKEINFTASQLELLSVITDPVEKQTIIDFIHNQNFRKDYWVRGSVEIDQDLAYNELKKYNIVLTKEFENDSYTAKSRLGEISLTKEVYSPIIDLISGSNYIQISRIHEKLVKTGVLNQSQLFQAVQVLIGLNKIQFFQPSQSKKLENTYAKKLNDKILNRALYDEKLKFLISPITGCGVPLGRMGMLFIRSIKSGEQNPVEWAKYALNIINSQNQKLINNGNIVEDSAQAKTILETQALEFRNDDLKLIKRLGIL